MDLESLLFYLYPIALEYEKDSNLWDRVNSFMSALNYKLPKNTDEFIKEDLEALEEGLQWIYSAHGFHTKGWLEGHTGKLIEQR